MIPYRVLLPVMGAGATFVLGVALSFSALPTGWAIAVIAIAALFVVLATERLVHVVDVFTAWSLDARSIAFRLIAVAVLLDGVMAAALVITGLNTLLTWLLGLAALTTVQVLAGALANTYLGRLHPRLAQERQRRAEAAQTARGHDLVPQTLTRNETNPDEPPVSHDILVMRAALQKIKLGWLVIKEAEPLQDSDGVFFGIRFRVQITAEAMSNPKRRSISTDSAEPIAVALSELLNQELETRWVGVQGLKRAGGYTITVTTQDVMARLYPFIDEDDWADISEPALIGYGLDAREVRLNLQKHGQYIGKTRSGKTSLINGVLAYLTRCHNAVVWICGTMKLYDMLAGWLEIYLDTGEEMPFDFVAFGPQDTAECLAGLLRVGRYRQSLPLSKRVNLPDIVCILDEASFALRNTTVTVTVDGRELTISATCGDIAQGVGSAGCWLKYSTQRDTNDQLGPAGGDVQAQVGYTAAFATQDGLSLGRQLGDFKLPSPGHKGEFYLRDDDGAPYPVLVKGRYMQEVDPKRPHLHDGLTVSEVSWSRRKFKTHLDEGSQRAAGDFYANRYTTVTQEFLDYLRGIKPSTGAPSKENDIEAEAIVLAQKMGLDYDTMPAEQKEAFRIAAQEMHNDVPVQDVKPAPKNRTELIVQILRDKDGPMSSADLIMAMHECGHEVKNEVAVYNLLGQLVTKNVLIKDDDRLYRLAG